MDGESFSDHPSDLLLSCWSDSPTPSVSLCPAAVIEATIQASRKMVDLLRTHDSEETLVLFLLSGGASALLELPAEGIPLAELAATNALLLESGASIHEINTVRKHLSTTKGGRLVSRRRESWMDVTLRVCNFSPFSRGVCSWRLLRGVIG